MASEEMSFVFISEVSSSHCATEKNNSNKTKTQHPLIIYHAPNQRFSWFQAPSVSTGRGCACVAKFKIQHEIKPTVHRVQRPRPLIVEDALCHVSTWIAEAWQPLRPVSE